jgi:hypothetical protein
MHTLRVMLTVTAVAAAMILSTQSNGQGDSGFLRGKGKLDLALTYAVDTYDKFWLGDTKIDNDDAGFGRIYRQTGNIYGAYGLTDDIDLAVSASYVYASSEHIFPHENDFQDMGVQIKWRFVTCDIGPGKLNLLAAPAVKFPLSHYQDNAVTAIGDGNVDLRARGILQYVFDNGVFAAVESGYDFRFDSPPDEIPINVTVGFTLWNKLTISGFYSKIVSFGHSDIGEVPFPGVEEEYDRVGGGIYFRITEGFGITANA